MRRSGMFNASWQLGQRMVFLKPSNQWYFLQLSEWDGTKHVFHTRHSNQYVTSIKHFATMTTAGYKTAAPAGRRFIVVALRGRRAFTEPGKWSYLLNDSFCISLSIYITCDTNCIVTLQTKSQIWHHWLRSFGETLFPLFPPVYSFLS